MVATATAWSCERPDREIDVSLPSLCPDCGGEVELERTAEQFQVGPSSDAPVTNQIQRQGRALQGCGKRVQGRHAEQTSTQLGAASSQVGPSAKGVGGCCTRAGLSSQRRPAA